MFINECYLNIYLIIHFRKLLNDQTNNTKEKFIKCITNLTSLEKVRLKLTPIRQIVFNMIFKKLFHLLFG